MVAKTASPARKPAAPETGVIHADTLYTRSALMRILGVRDSAIRTAKRRGLRPAPAFGQEMYFGRDVMNYCQGLLAPEPSTGS